MIWPRYSPPSHGVFFFPEIWIVYENYGISLTFTRADLLYRVAKKSTWPVTLHSLKAQNSNHAKSWFLNTQSYDTKWCYHINSCHSKKIAKHVWTCLKPCSDSIINMIWIVTIYMTFKPCPNLFRFNMIQIVTILMMFKHV